MVQYHGTRVLRTMVHVYVPWYTLSVPLVLLYEDVPWYVNVYQLVHLYLHVYVLVRVPTWYWTNGDSRGRPRR
jgi:hypothetical protein